MHKREVFHKWTCHWQVMEKICMDTWMNGWMLLCMSVQGRLTRRTDGQTDNLFFVQSPPELLFRKTEPQRFHKHGSYKKIHFFNCLGKLSFNVLINMVLIKKKVHSQSIWFYLVL